jgi:hypothetical protein
MNKNPQNKTFSMLFAPLLLLTLNSCIGVSMDIQMRKDGSARVNLEYRYPVMAEAVGKLDGNEKWPFIPIGRADWERTTERVFGMKLISFSSSQQKNSQEIVTNAALEFDNAASLLQFLDPAGNRASLAVGRLEIIMNEPLSSEINSDLLELIRQLSGNYRFAVSFTAEGNSTLVITDAGGKEISPPQDAQIIPSGRKTSFSIPIAQIFTLQNGLGMRFIW